MEKENELKRLMELKSGSVKAFSEEIGLAYTTVRSILQRGVYNSNVENVLKICKGLNLKAEKILDYDNGEQELETEIDTLPVKEIPIVSQISAGLPIYAEENILEHTYIATKKLNSNKEIFGLRVNGDSMDKEFRNGDVVIVEKDSVVENGQIAVVQVNGYNATVKRVRYEKDRIILIPESNNPAHYPQVYSQDDEVKIIGKVVSSQKFY
ncbi:transcriptional regulator [Staphylococcus capitis]|uniref:LexA family protein n=1 Tax=Staphylococcus capitis TaxID=29388 RepID=UPI0021A974E4|nr:S24 family peptidase [Staphylococcus capitis]MCT2014645.1 transcriptional regulator [Staphylococcus capitis]